MLNVKKLGINNIFLVIAITVLIIAASTCVFYSTVNNTVLAETISDSLLNFNQLINNNYINFNNDVVEVKNVSTINNNLKNHIFYFSIKLSNVVNCAFALNTNSGNIDIHTFSNSNKTLITITNNVNINFFGVYISQTNINVSDFQLIDLTQMFGAGNEPSLEECEKIFITTYNYTSSYYLSNENLYYYTAGIQDTKNAITITQPLTNYYQLITNYTASNFSINSATDGGGVVFKNGAIRFGVGYDLIAGDKIEITVIILNPSGDLSLYIQQLNTNGNLENLLTIDYSDWEYQESTGLTGGTTYTGTITIPIKYIDNAFYITATDTATLLFNQMKITTYNTTAQTQAAYKQGIDSVNTDYYFQQGVKEGIKQGMAQGSAWGNSWEFISSCFNGIGDILAIEILPNLPLYTFIAIPLLLGLIVLIYKLIGSGG